MSDALDMGRSMAEATTPRVEAALLGRNVAWLPGRVVEDKGIEP